MLIDLSDESVAFQTALKPLFIPLFEHFSQHRYTTKDLKGVLSLRKLFNKWSKVLILLRPWISMFNQKELNNF